ncbi:hypothetical protein CRYUN_Cryun24cG0098900 [Craigia yunnanensis]
MFSFSRQNRPHDPLVRVRGMLGWGVRYGCMVKIGLERRVKVCNAVMDMYGKCGMVGDMRWRKKMWCHGGKKCGVMDSGYGWGVEVGVCKESKGGVEVEDSGEMEEKNAEEKNVVSWTMVLDVVLKWEGSGEVVMGRWIHVYGLKIMGMEMDIMVGTAMLDMYAKCGRVDTAVKVFECMPRRNVVAWNAMLSGHSGLIDQASYYFDSLESVYGLTPKIDHYAYMVDLLGRASRLEEDETLIKRMPIPPNEVVLGSLLGSCNSHGKLQLAEHVVG